MYSPQGEAPAPAPSAAPQGAGAASPVHDALSQRFNALSPQDHDALDQGVSPEAAAVIMKLVPELGEILMALEQNAGGEESPPEPEAEMETMEDEAGAGGKPPFPPRRPTTALGRM